MQNKGTEPYGMTHDYRAERRCFYCGKRCQSDGTPVTVGGWYGEIEYAWNSGQLATVSCVCTACKREHPHYSCGDDEQGNHYPTWSCPDAIEVWL